MKTYKGELNKGIVRVTEGQQKKLYSMMTPEELEKCYIAIINLAGKYWKISKHLKEKTAVTWSLKDIMETIRTGSFDIVEYNRTGNDIRIVVNSYKIYSVDIDGKETTCTMTIVLSIRHNKIITLWYNDILDSHKSINMKRYNKDLEIIF